MIRYGRANSDKDLTQILELQKKNLPTAITSEEKKTEGFVTVSHSIEILSTMNAVCPHVIAKSDGILIGYALCMHPQFADDIEVLRPMFEQIDSILPLGKKYIIMGQICIDKAFRGQGVFRQLYRTMQNTVRPEFDHIITEVDAENTRSLQAHYAVGFEDLKSYSSEHRIWRLMSLNVSYL
ncbi:MAG: GNAT family N-acetyltransferase [Pricia sp.]